jgi:hypothetical protein
MKKLLIGLAMAVAAMAALAEPTFDQMQSMIGQKQYSSAAAGLEVIIQNHPTSAKAFYAMAQAQAGLGDLAKAKRALDKARGLDPELKFASEDTVKALEQAITPQVAKIEVIEPSHFWRNLILVLLAALGGGAFYFYRKKDKPADAPYAGHVPPEPMPSPAAPVMESPSDLAYMKANNLVDTPAKRGRPLKSSYSSAAKPAAPVQPVYVAPVDAYRPTYQAPVQPTVINNHYGSSNSGSGDLLTGVLIGEALSSNHHSHHDTYVEREVIVERPVYREPTPTYTAPSRSSTWDDTPAPTPAKSSSWDDTPSKSSSWDDSSSSSSSSSWSDNSSSSDSSSSSSDW